MRFWKECFNNECGGMAEVEWGGLGLGVGSGSL